MSILRFVKTKGIYIAAVLVVLSSVHTGLKLRGRGGVVEEARSELAREEVKKQKLEAIRAGLDSGEFIEQQARDKLGLVREGETIVVLPPAEELRRFAPREEVFDVEFEREMLPIFRQWVRLFLPGVEKAIRG